MKCAKTMTRIPFKIESIHCAFNSISATGAAERKMLLFVSKTHLWLTQNPQHKNKNL